MSKYYVCKKIKLLSFLQSRGFNFINYKHDRNDKRRLVWLFSNSNELQEVVTEYYRGH